MNRDFQPETALVVGSGIIGIACAHYLSHAGLRVTVIDRRTTAGACSHANCGFVCPSHVLPLAHPGAVGEAIKSLFKRNDALRIKPRLSPALWKWLWKFARRCNRRDMLASAAGLKPLLDSSMEEYRRLMAEESLDCEWREDGLLFVLQTQRGMREFADTDQLLRDEFGLAAERIEAADLPAFEPALKPGLAGAFHYADDASVRPESLNADWSRRLRDRGVEFLEQCEMHGLRKSSGKILAVQTSRGEMTADRYLFATGAWSARIASWLECRIPIQPGKGYSLTTSRPGPAPRYSMLFPEHKVGVSIFEGGCRLGSMMEFAGYDGTIPPRRLRYLRESAANYLAGPLSDDDQHTWYGWRPMTWDSLPIIGPVPRLTNAYLATGHNMLGLSLAAGTGRLIAEMVHHRPTHIDATPFSPERFD